MRQHYAVSQLDDLGQDLPGVITRGQLRTSPRQAIVALFEQTGEDLTAPFVVPLALDVVGSMVAVNGATLSVGCDSLETAAVLAPNLQVGVDLYVRPGSVKEPLLYWLARQHVERGFESIVFVSADAVGVSPRLLSTALSVLASEEMVIGSTPGGLIYLLGLRADVVPNIPSNLISVIEAFTKGEKWPKVGRRVEWRTRLREIASIDDLRDKAGEHSKYMPRTLNRIASLPT